MIKNYTVNNDEDDDNINNLDDIHEFLEEGVDENKFSPEKDQVEFHDGDFLT